MDRTTSAWAVAIGGATANWVNAGAADIGGAMQLRRQNDIGD
jgi:hypothetical protein